jgi:predicted RecB family nuclease
MKLNQSQLNLISNALKHYAEHLERDIDANEEELSVYDQSPISNLMFQFSQFHLIPEYDMNRINHIIQNATTLTEKEYPYLAGYRESALNQIQEIIAR